MITGNAYKTSNIKSTGCYSVDLAINCVDFYRKVNRPIKSVILSRYHYDKFVRWNLEKAMEFYNTTEEPENQPWFIDGVEIKKSETFLVEDLKVEFWPAVRTAENDELFLKNKELKTTVKNQLDK